MKYLALCLCLAGARPGGDERVLFDFETPEEASCWSTLGVPPDADKRIREEPPATVALSPENVSSRKHSLKLTFAGGRWPTVTTALPNEDWMPFHRLKADLWVTRPCLVGFTVLQERSSRKEGWDPVVGRWTKTVFAQPGRNEVSEVLHRNDWQAIMPKLGPVVRFEIFMYAPHPGESIWVDNVRLIAGKDKEPEVKRSFKVLGTDWTVSGVQELGKKLKDRWVKPEPKTVEQIEAEFKAQHGKGKAVVVAFRDGENGYNGWKDAYFNSHGPDGMTFERSQNFGSHETAEIFMRHRSPLHRVDLSSIPKGAAILAARLLIVSATTEFEKGRDPLVNANMWAVEACNRPWVESEVNSYEYAKDKFWKEIGGQYYGDDPDFLPLYLAYGPGNAPVSSWDFTEAVKYWTDGTHENHGFMLHGDSYHWMGRAYYREAKEVKNRPALLVAYEPK